MSDKTTMYSAEWEGELRNELFHAVRYDKNIAGGFIPLRLLNPILNKILNKIKQEKAITTPSTGREEMKKENPKTDPTRKSNNHP